MPSSTLSATVPCSAIFLACLAATMINLSSSHDIRFHRFRPRHRRQELEEPPAPTRPRPLFDQIFAPLFGEAGTLKGFEHNINVVGGKMNRKIDTIHDEDHGLRICNQEDGADSHGACLITATKCKGLNGLPIGRCDSHFNPFSTCCRFERTCSEESESTVAYFKSDSAMEEHSRCRLRVRSRVGACQIRIDFLDFMFPQADPLTGRCSESARLRITNFIGGPGSPTTTELELCGSNSGQHVYLDVAQARQLVELDVVREDKSIPISWHLRITQVDCRSTLGFPFSSGIRAPQGCLQYHYDRPRGAVTSFNFDLVSPIAPGQNYAVCFSSHRSFCGIRLKEHHFSLGDSGSSFVHVFDPADEDGAPFDQDRIGGSNFGTVVATHKPFVVTVKTGEEADTEAKGFLLEYEFVQC